jgi:hypothetical protein
MPVRASSPDGPVNGIEEGGSTRVVEFHSGVECVPETV